jgi:CRISPR-associated protein Cas2
MNPFYRRTWMIAYDIADRRRLARVHRYLKRRATPVQYSVFAAELRRIEIADMILDLTVLIDSRRDDVRIYNLTDDAWIRCFGRQNAPEGLELKGGSRTFQRLLGIRGQGL